MRQYPPQSSMSFSLGPQAPPTKQRPKVNLLVTSLGFCQPSCHSSNHKSSPGPFLCSSEGYNSLQPGLCTCCFFCLKAYSSYTRQFLPTLSYSSGLRFHGSSSGKTSLLPTLCYACPLSHVSQCVVTVNGLSPQVALAGAETLPDSLFYLPGSQYRVGAQRTVQGGGRAAERHDLEVY